MKNSLAAAAAVLIAASVGQADVTAERPISSDGTDPATWDPALDGPIAAPDNHEVVFENDNIRIMSVSVQPGEAEPYHLHAKCAVLVFDQPVKVTDRVGDGEIEQEGLVWASIPWLGEGVPEQIPFVWVQPPEAPHSITNEDTRPLHLTRIEMKKGCDAPPRSEAFQP